MSRRNIEIIETKDGHKTISVNKVLLHSKYRPVEEAVRWAESQKEEIKGKKYVVLYGAGFGYHIKALSYVIDKDCQLVVVDFDKEIINEAKKNGMLNEVDFLDNTKVMLSLDEKENFRIIKNELNKADILIIYRPCLNVLPEDYGKVKEIIRDYYEATMVMKQFQKDIEFNIVENGKIISKPIDDFFKECNYKGETIVVAASGPSLKESLEELKIVREKVKVFCVGSSLKPLMINGIKPDMICFLDPQEMVYEQIRGYENLDVPMCFLYTASNKAVSSYLGPKYIFYNCTKERNRVIEVGNSVATAVLSIAIEGCAGKIIFIGQDLAFINNKTHTADTMYGEALRYVEARKTNTVVGVNGEILKTSSGLLNFKRWIERKISYTSEIEFINCSRGAKIQGTVEMDLLDAISNNIVGGKS